MSHEVEKFYRPRRIALIEDESALRRLCALRLAGSEHSIVIEAATMPEALEALSHFEELGVNMALLDGNLSGGSSGNDGEKLAGAIKDRFPQVTIVGFSSNPEGVRGADVSLDKSELLMNNGLITAIDTLATDSV